MKKSKKIISLVLAIAMVLLVPVSVVSAAPKGYGFRYAGVTVYVHGKASGLIDKMGEPNKKSKSKSCAYDGEDIKYVYDDFIFPLAGGSVSGVVHFLNNDYFALALMAGMDSEQSGESPRVPFSMVVHIDKLLTDYLEAWKKGDEWQHHAVFGLNEQAVEIVMNERFGYDLNIWDDRCSLEKFENYHRLYVNEAKELESDYISNIFER